MKAIRKAATVEGHSLTASVYRQLPSLFSKQIARRLANEERGLAEKNKETVVVNNTPSGSSSSSKPKKKRSRLSFLDFTTTTNKKKVVPVSSTNRGDSSTKSNKRASMFGQLKKTLIKKLSSTSSTSSTSSLNRIEEERPPGVSGDGGSSMYGEEEVAVLRRSIYGADNTKPLVSAEDTKLDDDEIQDFVKESSANPYKRHIATSKKVPTSANPYMR